MNEWYDMMMMNDEWMNDEWWMMMNDDMNDDEWWMNK